jgi:hypothetical protein
MMITPIIPGCKKLGRWNMLSIVNWSDQSKDYRIVLDNRFLENLKGDKFLVYDFKSKKVIEQLKPGEVLAIGGIEGHQSRLLKIVPWDGESAIFIGTDLNFACGGLEIKKISYEHGKISGILDTPWYTPVTLTFLIPSETGLETKLLHMSPGQRMFFLDY